MSEVHFLLDPNMIVSNLRKHSYKIGHRRYDIYLLASKLPAE